jgi:hypothetical protein
METKLALEILPQPDDTTCGPTCLHAIYNYFGYDYSLEHVIETVPALEGGGTLGVTLALHALKNGFKSKIFTYNMMVFDPTWFQSPQVDLVGKLQAQMQVKKDRKFRYASQQYMDYLKAGGTLAFQDLTRSLIRKYLSRGIPVLTGLNATYLYRSVRVESDTMQDDDIRGEVVGHFVVLCGYDRIKKTVSIADPYQANPYSESQYYEIDIDRVISAVLLGIMTYDANLLIIEPPEAGRMSEKR